MIKRILLLFLLPAILFGQEIPNNIGRVNDFAHLLSYEQKQTLEVQLETFEQEKGQQIVIVTVPSLQGYSVESFTNKLANTWGVGRGDGIVLLVAPNERKARIETANNSGLSGSKSNHIMQNVIIPEFRRGRMAEGIVKGATAILNTLRVPVETSQPIATQPVLNTTPKEKDYSGLWYLVAVGGIFGVVALAYIINKHNSARNDNIELKKRIVAKFYRTKPAIAEATTALEEIRKISKSIYEEYSRKIDELAYNQLEEKLNINAKSWFSKEFVKERLEDLKDTIDTFSDRASEVIELKRVVPEKRSEYKDNVKSIPEILAKAKTAAGHPDVKASTCFELQCIEDGFLKLGKDDNWISQAQNSKQIYNKAKNVVLNINHDIEYAKEARENGPKLLKELENKIKELENGKKSKRRKQYIESARSDYDRALGYNDNWLLAYALLLSANQSVSNAYSAPEVDSSYRSSSYSSDSSSSSWSSSDSSSSSWDSGGGGGFDGGGSSGSW